MTNTKPPAELSPEELEAHIYDTGHLMELEMARGNREAALGWMQVMQDAIKARGPATVARMEAERGLTSELYFLNQAERDMPALLRRQAA